jgi:dTDP-3-amino-2,3,6-trideoxy-4-keto-D-glucose/dTDP-3-amino-3,4,6-trideoxy-alpha-D-glucose/dTDP-2,6-dideoxy-D-kanosamine transaminase
MNDRIPFFSAKAIHEGFDAQAAIGRVLASHWYVMGEEVKAFESSFAAYCGVKHCVSLANGTDALELALRAVGVGPGKSVMLVANAGFYGSTALHLVGGQPVYVEVDADTLTMCPKALATALAAAPEKPQAIIATHLYGQLAAIEDIAALARQHGIALVEDCAQSHGARRVGSPGHDGDQLAGSFGDIAAYSFYPTKNLGALGDGGAVVCNDDALAACVRSLRQYGWSGKYRNDLPLGRNSRLDEIQAAILRDKLPLLDAANAQRQATALYYHAHLAGLPLKLPASTGADFVAHLYVMRTPQRDALKAFLDAQGITTDVHYPIADHRQKAYAQLHTAVSLPVTEAACETAITLPCYPGMPAQDQQRVVRAVQSFFSSTH